MTVRRTLGRIIRKYLGKVGVPGRLETLRRGLTKSHKIVEVGPCHSPIFPKRDGWSAFSIDHATQAGLREKYRLDATVDPTLIEPVDFVWLGGKLTDPVPPEHLGTFDLFVASHVVEHTPNLVAFLEAADVLTKPDGRLLLAVPDKRVCFDYYRPISTIGNVLEAFDQARTRHTIGTLWDHSSYLVFKRGQPGWRRTERAKTEFYMTFREAAALVEVEKSKAYADAHGWVFVPASFELIVLQLARLGLTDWRIERIDVAASTEFLVWLVKGAKAELAGVPEGVFSEMRHALLEESLLQLDAQSLQFSIKDRLRRLLGRRRNPLGSTNRRRE